MVETASFNKMHCINFCFCSETLGHLRNMRPTRRLFLSLSFKSQTIFLCITLLRIITIPSCHKVERTDSLELIPAMANSRKPSTPGTTGATTLTTTSLLSASQASFRYCTRKKRFLEHFMQKYQKKVRQWATSRLLFFDHLSDQCRQDKEKGWKRGQFSIRDK